MPATNNKLFRLLESYRKALIGALLVCVVIIWTCSQLRGTVSLQSKKKKLTDHCSSIRAHAARDFRFDSPSDFRLSQLKDELSVVTAFFDIGSFAKGAANARQFTRDLYRQWMTSFALVENHVIGFFDTETNLEYFRSVRSRLPANRTCLVLVNRSRLWSFSPETHSRITAIYGQPNYPKHFPNTVVPLYSMSMYAKYEVVQIAIASNPFSTRYFSWLDIGLFRDLSVDVIPPATLLNSSRKQTGDPFLLYMPPEFTTKDSTVENSSIAVCEVYARQETLTPRSIVNGNHVWIGGGFFAGRVDVMYTWTTEFLASTRWLLDQNISSTDQQVIYSMYNAAGMNLTTPPQTRLQRYRSDGRFNDWFHLAYLARAEGTKILKNTDRTAQ